MKSEKLKLLVKKSYLAYVFAIIAFAYTFKSCKQDKSKSSGDEHDNVLQGIFNQKKDMPFDSTLIDSFYMSHTQLEKYSAEVKKVYREHDFTQLWYDKLGLVEFAFILYDKVRNLESEGILAEFPYQQSVDELFGNIYIGNRIPVIKSELLMTNLYLFYTEKVYEGFDESTTRSLGWHLPRSKVSYSGLIHSVIDEPEKLEGTDSLLLYSQFYKLRHVLKKYLEIEQRGGWGRIDTAFGSFIPGDSGKVIRQVRERLYITGELEHDNKSNLYDPELVEAVKKYQQFNGMNVTEKILPRHVKAMNIPVSERILQIAINMERCRWIPVKFEEASEYILVNVPSFKLNFYRNSKSILESPVVVGDEMNQTVIFSGSMSYIVFSPYWNIPDNILENEIKPKIVKDSKYLKRHNMEWSGNRLRQKPGKNNSMGLVKFMFPNSNAIYLHDTPAKSLFEKEKRTYSHGCIRVAKARELAVMIMKNDQNWDDQMVDMAMNAGTESTYVLNSKIPVYIIYLTAMVDNAGNVHFYRDVYDMDKRLANLLML